MRTPVSIKLLVSPRNLAAITFAVVAVIAAVRFASWTSTPKRTPPPEAVALWELNVEALLKDDAVYKVDFKYPEGADDSALQYLQNASGLEILRLGRQCKGEGLRYLRNAPRLWQADLRFATIRDQDLQHVVTWQGLRDLYLGGPAITDQGAKYLESLPGLFYLHLINTRITDSAMESIGKIDHLVTLSIEGAPINGSGLVHLARLRSLRDLDLPQTGITDENLAAIERCSNLKGLTLRNTPISGAGLIHLTRLPQLKELDLRGTKVRREHIAPLIEANPNLSVLIDEGFVKEEIKRGRESLFYRNSPRNLAGCLCWLV